MNDLVISYYAAGRRDQAMKLMEEVLALRLKVNGPEHPDTLKGMGNLGNIYAENGRQDTLAHQEEIGIFLHPP